MLGGRKNGDVIEREEQQKGRNESPVSYKDASNLYEHSTKEGKP